MPVVLRLACLAGCLLVVCLAMEAMEAMQVVRLVAARLVDVHGTNLSFRHCRRNCIVPDDASGVGDDEAAYLVVAGAEDRLAAEV